MNDTPSPPPTRDELRQRFLRHAGAAFDLLFGPQYQDQLVTFEQREQRACELGSDLITWVLQQHVNADPSARPDPVRPPACPRCARPGRPVGKADDPLPRRSVTTSAAEVTLARQKWRCVTCRVVFFPPRPAVAVGDGGVQPDRPA